MKRFYFLVAVLLFPFLSHAQTPGLIYKTAGTGASVLDPNGDGYTSETISGFKTNDQLESEIQYKPLVVPAIEPVADPGPGPDCSFNDIVDSGNEDPVFSYYDNTNLLFRFRLGGAAPNSKGYSILIDTDQKFGISGSSADPNAVAGNPGFEIEVVLRTNFDVKIYDVDGKTSPVEKASYSYDNYAQKSIALTTNCGDTDYFYDFFIPFSGITNNFPGITATTPLRMVAVTSMNPSAAIGNNAVSDVGGIDDQVAGYNFDYIFQSVVDNFYPTPIDKIGDPDYYKDRTSCPSITGPIAVAASSISGTSTEEDGTVIKVFKNDELLNTTTVSTGEWTLSGLTGIVADDVITASATAPNKGESINNCSTVTVAASCSPDVTINLTNTNTKNIGGSGVAGATINVYKNGVLISSNPTSSATVDGTGTFCWKTNGNTGSCNGGSGNLSGSYKVTQTVPGQCESAGIYVCVSGTVSTPPSINAIPDILATATSVSGTSAAGDYIILFADGVQIGTTTAATTDWTISGLTLQTGQTLTAKAISGTNCISDASGAVTVTSVSSVPAITFAACGESGKYSTISGTSAEANGSNVYIYLDGSATAAGTATVFNGVWATSVLLSGQTSATAKAEGPGKTISEVSASHPITYKSAAPSFTINNNEPVVEGITSLSGTTSSAGTLNIYIDGSLLGSTTDANWTINGLNETNFYAGGRITATLDNGGCESAETTAVIIQCLEPSATLDITPLSTTICAGETATTTVALAEAGIIYQLYHDGVASGSARLGTGADLDLTSNALSASSSLSIKAIKISPVSCFTYLDQIMAVTVNPVISNNTLTAPDATTFCGTGDPGEITGSTPTGGTGDYSYQWESSTDDITYTVITGSTTQSYDPPAVNTTTYFRRRVNTGACNNLSSSVTITVQTTDLTNTITSPLATSYCNGDDPDIIQGSTPEGGTGTYTYQWQSSSDNSVFTNITNEISQHYDPATITSTVYIRRLVSSGTCENHSSNVVKFTVASGETTTITAATASMSADGLSTTTITVQLKDEEGNALEADICTPVLSTTAGSLSSLNYEGNGRYSATLTSSNEAGTAEVSGSLNGAPITDKATVTYTPGSQVASASNSVITASPSSITANGIATSTISIQIKDTDGNNFSTSGGTVSLTTTTGSLSAVQDHGDGTYTATLTSSTVAGTATITGELQDDPITDDEQVSFVAGPASTATSLITASDMSITADGTSTTAITIQLKDEHGNDLTNGGTIVNLQTSLGSLSVVTDHGDGTYSSTLTSSTTAGTATINGSIGEEAITDQTEVGFVAGEASLQTTTITATDAAILADGESTTIITVQLKDASGNLLTSSAGSIELATTTGTLSSVTDNADGSYTATLTSATAAGTAEITATLDNAPLEQKETVSFIPGSADVEHITVSTNSESLTADGTSQTTINIQLKDEHGNNLSSSAGTIKLEISPAGQGTLSAVTDNGDGTYTATLTSSTETATVEVSASLDESPITDKATVTFTPGIADATQTTITAADEFITADGLSTTTITVQLRDAHGNLANSPAGSFSLEASSTGAATLSEAIYAGNGQYTAILTSSTATGTVEITGTLDDVDITDRAIVVLVPGPASTATSLITASITSMTADGTSTTTITIQLKDAHGNNLTAGGTMVDVQTSLGTISAIIDHGDGTYSATLTAANTGGTATITGTIEGIAIEDIENVNFVAEIPSAATTTITADDASIEANGTSTTTIRVQLKDADGQPLTSDAATIVLTTSKGVVSSVAYSGTGQYTAILKSSTQLETATITGTLNSSPITAKAYVAFVTGTASPATSTIIAATPTIKADGSSQTTITIQLKDAAGHDVKTGGVDLKLHTTTGEILSPVTDNGDGTYTATLITPVNTGEAIISGTLNGENMTAKVTVTFEVNPPISAKSVATASPASITANGTSSSLVTVQLKDGYGNNIMEGGATVEFSTSSGTLSHVTDHGDGTYTATLTSSTLAGKATITATVDGSHIPNEAMVDFVAGPPSPATSLINISVASMAADGSSTSSITIQLKDAFGNDITKGGASITLSSTLGAISSLVDHGDGTYTATFTSSTTAGTATISGSIGEEAITDQAQVEMIAMPNPLTAKIAVDKASLPADGVSTAVISVVVKDSKGNRVEEKIITLTTTAGSLSAITEEGNGVYTAILTASTQEGEAVISGTLQGVAIDENIIVTFMPTPPEAKLFIPEGFSPDGDGVNDRFVIEGAEDMKVTLTVYNRWGNEVYQAKEYKNDWEGLANKGIVIGEKLPDGTYFYIVDFHNGEKPIVKYLTIKRK